MSRDVFPTFDELLDGGVRIPSGRVALRVIRGFFESSYARGGRSLDTVEELHEARRWYGSDAMDRVLGELDRILGGGAEGMKARREESAALALGRRIDSRVPRRLRLECGVREAGEAALNLLRAGIEKALAKLEGDAYEPYEYA